MQQQILLRLWTQCKWQAPLGVYLEATFVAPIGADAPAASAGLTVNQLSGVWVSSASPPTTPGLTVNQMMGVWVASASPSGPVLSVTGRRVARKVKEKEIDTHALMVEQIQMDERDLVSVVVAIVRAI